MLIFLCFYNTGCRIVQHCTTIQHILLTKFTVSSAGFAAPACGLPFIHVPYVLVSSTNVINDTQHFHKVLVSHYFTCIFWSTAPKLAFANYHHSFILCSSWFLSDFQCSLRSAVMCLQWPPWAGHRFVIVIVVIAIANGVNTATAGAAATAVGAV